MNRSHPPKLRRPRLFPRKAAFLNCLIWLGVVPVLLAQPIGEIEISTGAASRSAGPVTLELPADWPESITLQTSEGTPWPSQTIAPRQIRIVLAALDAGSVLRFVAEPASQEVGPTDPGSTPGQPARIRPLEDQQWELQAGVHRIIFQGQPGTFPRPGLHPSYRRGGYVHSVFSPSGLLVTDDFPPDHIHHHGIWTAWTRTDFQGRRPDFWNVRQESGRVEFDGIESTWQGPVEAGIESRLHSLDLTATPPIRVLDETWHLRLYRMPDPSPYTVFDLETTQVNVTEDALGLPDYHYGGLGVRGHRDWNGPTECFFLTSNGETDRVAGHATRANWCWMGGKVDGQLTGIAILCHPDNFRAPQPMRLHPSEPFFCYAPQQVGNMALEPGKPWKARYRFVVQDGPPNAEQLDQLWRDYALPPEVRFLTASSPTESSASSNRVSAPVEKPGKPNILFLFADDLSFETIGAAGWTDIDTPNLDRLSQMGTTWTHTYNMGSFSPAVCVASRTMLVTGRSLWHARPLHNTPALEKEVAAGSLWPLQMKAAGYRTCFTGKWHVPIDPKSVFDEIRHPRPGMPKDTAEAYSRPTADGSDPWDPADPRFGGFWEGGRHWTEVTAEDTIQFLQSSSRDSKPFFIYTAFNAPHDPRQSPQEMLDRYPLDRIKVPTNFLPEYPHAREIGCGPGLRDEKLGPFPRTEHAVQVHRREYYSMITHLDAEIGRILDALEASGQADSTWIFFTADHGLAVGHHGLFGKQNMYDHSLRVPMIVCGPGVPAGKRISTPAHLQDVAATALDIAGVEKPDWMHFQSLKPDWVDPDVSRPAPPIYAAYLNLQRAVIADDYKLIWYPEVSVWKLFHLPSDPHETRDLAGDPAYAQVLQSLKLRLRNLQQTHADPLLESI